MRHRTQWPLLKLLRLSPLFFVFTFLPKRLYLGFWIFACKLILTPKEKRKNGGRPPPPPICLVFRSGGNFNKRYNGPSLQERSITQREVRTHLDVRYISVIQTLRYKQRGGKYQLITDASLLSHCHIFSLIQKVYLLTTLLYGYFKLIHIYIMRY